MQHSNFHTIIFVSFMAIISSLLLSLTYTSLKPMQDINVEVDMKKNILKSIGKNTDTMDSEDVVKMYDDIIVEVVLSMEGEIDTSIAIGDLESIENKSTGEIKYIYNSVRYLPAYESTDLSAAFIIPISGKGLWSTLYGYFAISKDDYSTSKGITFYKHGETPGLGAEVEEDWFQNQFKESSEKKIFNSSGELKSISVVKKARISDHHEVDGISGATITSKGVSDFLFRDINNYKFYLIKEYNKKNG